MKILEALARRLRSRATATTRMVYSSTHESHRHGLDLLAKAQFLELIAEDIEAVLLQVQEEERALDLEAAGKLR